MASIQLGGGVIDARGSIAGNSFSRARSGATMKARIKGTNPITASQSLRRVSLDQTVKYWRDGLSDLDRASWSAWAASNPVLNRFGVTVTQSAFNAFVQLNATVLRIGGTIQTLPPASTTIAQMVSGSLALDHTDPSPLQVTLTTTGLGTDDVISVWMSPFVSQGKGFISHQLRHVTTFNADGTFAFDTPYTGVFGTTVFDAGMKMFCRAEVVNSVNGLRSAPLQFSAIST